MRKVTVFGRKITNWELVNSNLKPHLDEMGQVKPLADRLTQVIADARSIDSQQEIARGQLRELIRRRKDAEAEGENLRVRIGSVLKGQFGFTSESLIQFGVTPRSNKRKQKAGSQPPAETPSPEPPTATPPPAASPTPTKS